VLVDEVIIYRPFEFKTGHRPFLSVLREFERCLNYSRVASIKQSIFWQTRLSKVGLSQRVAQPRKAETATQRKTAAHLEKEMRRFDFSARFLTL